MVGDKIKELRKRKKISQTDLAAALQIPKVRLQAIERGRIVPSKTNVVMLSEIFQVSTDVILGRDTNNDVDLSGLSEEDFEIVYTLVCKLRKRSVPRDNKEQIQPSYRKIFRSQ